MFADEIAAELGVSSFYKTNCYISRIRASLDSSIKFVCDEILVQAMEELITKKPTQFVEILHLARAPFASTWVEYDFKHSGGQIRKIGFLISEFQSSNGQFIIRCFTALKDQPSWSLGVLMLMDLGPNIPDWRTSSFGKKCAQSAQIEMGLRLVGTDSPASIENMRASIIANESERFDKAELSQLLASEKELSARLELNRRILPLVDHLFFLPGSLEKNLEDLVERSMAMWMQGNVFSVIAFLAFLNSRNSINYQPSIPGVKKIHVGNKTAYTQLYEHKILKLVLSKSQRQRLDAEGIVDPSARRIHLVRGHFKMRNQKLFWWSPFLRGNSKQGLITKDYEVSS